MSTAPFVHLHTHSHHSLRGGIASVEALMRRAAELEMPALALTDCLSLGGAVPALEAAGRHGVKAIIGCDLPLRPVTAPSELDEGGAKGQAPLPEITLLAESDLGLRHLTGLLNTALSRGDRPHITLSELGERREGLISLIGGPRSELFALLQRGRPALPDQWLSAVVGALGRERVIFEIVQFGAPFQSPETARLLEIADFLNLPAVATNDVWHIEPPHALVRDFLSGEPFDAGGWTQATRRHPPTAHFTTPHDMRERFAHHPELLEASLAIADRCHLTFDPSRRRFPLQDFSRGVDSNSFLWDLVFRQAPERLGSLTDDHKERLNAELNHIAEEELANYFLMLWRLASALDELGALRGVGEGLILTSLVAHVLGLTQVNPLLHDMPFRGLRAEGERWPILGLEVAGDTVPLVERLLGDICGATKIARVATMAKPRVRPVRRELCQWAGLSPAQTEKALGTWPRRTVSLDEAKRAWERANPDGDAPAGRAPRTVVHWMGQTLQGRRTPLEPLGGQIVISGEELTTLLPLAPVEGSRLPLALVDADVVDRLSLLRIEIRTPPAMAIIDHATQWVRREERAEFHPEQIPFDDHDTWVLVGRGRTTGLPGLDRISTKSRLRSAQPRSLEELLRVLSADEPLPEADHVPPIGHAILAVRCAHLKTHHPVSFMAAMLSQHHRSQRTLRVLLREATAMGIRVLAPDINTSQYKFTQEGGAVRAGLMCVRGMTPQAFTSIARARLGGPFQDPRDLWERTDHPVVSSTLAGNLIKGGVLDSLDTDRSRMLSQVAHLSRVAGRRSADNHTLDLFDAPPARDDNPADMIAPETLTRYEQSVLGTVLTRDPLQPHLDIIRRMHADGPETIQRADEGEGVCVVGFIDHDERCDLFGGGEPEQILDLEGQVVVVPPEIYAGLQEILGQGDPFLVAGLVGRHGHERYVRAQCVMPLDRVERHAQMVRSVRLDLSGENRRTLKLLVALARRCPGPTRIEITSPPPGVGRRLCAKLEQRRVLCAPPFQFGLRKILPDHAIDHHRDGVAPIATPTAA